MAIDRSVATKPRNWKLNDYLLKFSKPKPMKDPEQVTRLAKQWIKSLAAVGERQQQIEAKKKEAEAKRQAEAAHHS